jgi:hypothetical protein
MPLWYLGPDPTENNSVATVDYVKSLASLSLSESSVKDTIKGVFASKNYATYYWADQIINSPVAGQAFARATELDAAVQGKIPILGNDDKGKPLLSTANGPLALDSRGKITASLISTPSTQTVPQSYWGSQTYVTATKVSSERTIASVYVQPSVSKYYLLVTGTINAGTSLTGSYPQIVVRAGNSTSGPVVANGYGVGEFYGGGQMTAYYEAKSYSYPIPTWADKIDIALLAGGGGGVNGAALMGEGGTCGGWVFRTVTKSQLNGLYALNGVVGAGGLTANSLGFATRPTGEATTCQVPNVEAIETKDLGGKAGGFGTADAAALGLPQGTGQATISRAFNGNVYPPIPSGVSPPAPAAPEKTGNPPGGGGGGGKGSDTPTTKGTAGRGAPGAAYFYAYLNDDHPYSQVSIVPCPYSGGPFSGPITLYANVLRNGTAGTVDVTSVSPQIAVMVVPA